MENKKISECFKELIEELHNLSCSVELSESSPDNIATNFAVQFRKIGKFLMNTVHIKTGERNYRVIEIEFYYNDNKAHKDPYCHKSFEQSSMNKWYYNYFGLDISIGKIFNNDDKDKTKNFYGGILIRGIIQNLDNSKPIIGPSRLLKEFIFSSGDIFNNTGIEICVPEKPISENLDFEEIRRHFNHNEKLDGNKIFYNKEYRYINMKYFDSYEKKEKEEITKYLNSKNNMTNKYTLHQP